MDRDRLKEVHQTDLTESKVNEDFVDWLKNKGPSWLLFAMILVCAYLAVIRFKQGRSDYRSEAWSALATADLPGSFEDVAQEYGDVDQLANVARLEAAGQLVESVQRGVALGAGVANPASPLPIPTEPLSPEQREQYLKRADGLYAAVIDSDPGGQDLTLLVVNALNGKAAIAECRRDADAASSWYELAAERAEPYFPGLAAQARARAASAADLPPAFEFPTAEDVAARRADPRRPTPVRIDDALRELILPDETDG